MRGTVGVIAAWSADGIWDASPIGTGLRRAITVVRATVDRRSDIVSDTGTLLAYARCAIAVVYAYIILSIHSMGHTVAGVTKTRGAVCAVRAQTANGGLSASVGNAQAGSAVSVVTTRTSDRILGAFSTDARR